MEEEPIKAEKLEVIANDFILKGIEHRRAREIEQAVKYFAVSYGLNKYLERVKLMTLCRELLEGNISNKKELKKWQEWGCNMVLWALDLPYAVKKTLDE